MAKNKLRKFSEMDTFKNVVQPKSTFLDQDIDLKGRWNKDFFKNNNPIVIELGCGKGEYSIGLAERYPKKNFIGIDIKGSRIWQGASYALERGMSNVGFLRIMIEHIEKCFSASEVSEIWITFPDPQIKKKRSKKRLIHPQFLNKYSKMLSKGGLIHLKTDSKFLFNYTIDIIKEENYQLIDSTDDIYNDDNIRENMDILTYYEKQFLEEGSSITYIKFKISG